MLEEISHVTHKNGLEIATSWALNNYQVLKQLNPEHELLKFYRIHEGNIVEIIGEHLMEYSDRFKPDISKHNIESNAHYRKLLTLNYNQSLLDAILPYASGEFPDHEHPEKSDPALETKILLFELAFRWGMD